MTIEVFKFTLKSLMEILVPTIESLLRSGCGFFNNDCSKCIFMDEQSCIIKKIKSLVDKLEEKTKCHMK